MMDMNMLLADCKYCRLKISKPQQEEWAHDRCLRLFFFRRYNALCVVCGERGLAGAGYLFCGRHDEHSKYQGFGISQAIVKLD